MGAAQVLNGLRAGGFTVKADEQPGIGDEALFTVSKKSVDSGNNKVEQLYVRKGHVVMLLTASNLQGVKSDYRDKILQSYKLHFE